MKTKHRNFGPWSSALHQTNQVQLSAFWEQRIRRLACVMGDDFSDTKLLSCIVLGAVLLSLPMLAGTSASGEQAGDATPGNADQAKLSGTIYLSARLTAAADQGWNQNLVAVDPISGKWKDVLPIQTNKFRVSSDGRKIVFFRHLEGGVVFQDIQSGAINVLKMPIHMSFTLSPDGNQLLVSNREYDPHNSGTIVISASGAPSTFRLPTDEELKEHRTRFPGPQVGTRLVSLASGKPSEVELPKTDEVVDWSPDGKWWLATSMPPPAEENTPLSIDSLAGQTLSRVRGSTASIGNAFGELYLMRSDGSERRALTNRGGGCHMGRFSPDSKCVAYAWMYWTKGEAKPAFHSSICVVDLVSGRDRELVISHSQESTESVTYRDPAWSPDGKWLAASFVRLHRPVADGSQAAAEVTEERGLILIEVDGDDRREVQLAEGAELDLSTLDWR